MSIEYEVSAKLRTEPVLPEAGVYRADCPEGDCAEKTPLPAAVAAKPAENKSPSQWAYERLVLYIQKFEETLDTGHEVGMGFAGSDAGMIHIQGMGYFAPDMITFYGVDPAGAKTQLVQHVSQLNVMLKAAPKIHDEPLRIGFQMRSQMETEGEEGSKD
ncbi:MAG: DUF6173 family protein [Paracoccaceae bacterium]